MKAIFFVSLLFIISLCCPPKCNCSSKTLDCSTCLSQYYQFYNVIFNKCECLRNFSQYVGLKYHCCPDICEMCYEKGCATCKQGAKKKWNETLKFYDCICQQNYVRNGSSCVCLSSFHPQEYYYNSFTTKCYKCPQGCACNEAGCHSCKKQTNRTITRINSQQIVCQCNNQLIDVNGICSCFDKCTCQNNFVQDCSNESNTNIIDKKWKCKYPYTQVSNECHCLEPFVLLSEFNRTQCVCKSMIDHTKYYSLGYHSCHKCPQSCICDITGCVSCNGSRWKSQIFSCICPDPFMSVNGDCTCLEPYYLKQQSQQGSQTCACLSDLSIIVYQYNASTKICQKSCPKRCKCTEQGCIYCELNTLRQIINDSGRFSCPCVRGAIQQWESKQQCVCGFLQQYDFIKKSCVCKSQVSTDLVLQKDQFCYLCEKFCKCDSRGCYHCQKQARRRIYYDRQTFRCGCLPFLDIIDGQCVCGFGKQFNQSSGKCQCLKTHIIQYREGNQLTCGCRSKYEPTKYYVSVSQGCTQCPIGCICGENGCLSCDSLSLRKIYLSTIFIFSTSYDCLCLQNARLVNGICTVCDDNEFYNGDGCTPCQNCLTCHRYGCSSCKEDMTLVGYECICDNLNLTNIEGNCICQKGKYLNIFVNTNDSIICSACPLNCEACTVVNYLIQCISCNTNQTFRENIPEENCPCSVGYSEALVKSEYCCPNTCGDCNLAGCTSCPLYTFRILRQGKCICQEPYQQNGHIVCGCPPNNYYHNQSCLQCPLKCNGCTYDELQMSPICTQCTNDSNRNSSDLNCPCLEGFAEVVPERKYCSAKHCLKQQITCSKCSELRMLSDNGTCICKTGYYEQRETCQECKINGCTNCRSKSICDKCDQQNNFYLIHAACIQTISDGYIIFQIQKLGIVIQIKTNTSKMVSPQNHKSVVATLYLFQSANSTAIVNSFDIEIQSISFNSSIITVVLSHPPVELQNAIVSLVFNQMAANMSYINVKTGYLQSQNTINNNRNLVQNVVLGVGLVFIVATMALYLNGYKHNQILFYVQTLSFLSYYVLAKKVYITHMLYSLKVFSFNFASGPFSLLIPELYHESSQGNFRWLAGDSNILRVIDLPIFILIVVILLYCIVKPAFAHKTFSVKLIRYKKHTYRLFEFLFKALMYPATFFSINTLLNSGCEVFLNAEFKSVCIAIGAILLCFFFLFILYLWRYGQMSKLHNTELIVQFAINCLTSIAIIVTSSNQLLCLLIVFFIVTVKDSIYFVVRRILSKQRDWTHYLILTTLPLKLIPLLMIYYNMYQSAIATLIIALVFIILLQMVVIIRANKLAHYDKLRMSTEQSISNISEKAPEQLSYV